MAVVTHPSGAVWGVARWAFELLLVRARDVADASRHRLYEQAIALDGLHLGALPDEERQMVISDVNLAIAELRTDLQRHGARDPQERSLLEALDALEHALAT